MKKPYAAPAVRPGKQEVANAKASAQRMIAKHHGDKAQPKPGKMPMTDPDGDMD